MAWEVVGYVEAEIGVVIGRVRSCAGEFGCPVVVRTVANAELPWCDGWLWARQCWNSLARAGHGTRRAPGGPPAGADVLSVIVEN